MNEALLGDAAFWLEETLALAEQIAANLPRFGQDETAEAVAAGEAALFTANEFPAGEPAMSAAPGEPFTPAAAGKRRERKPASGAAAGFDRERRPEISPGATHILRRQREQAADLPVSGTPQQRADVPQLDVTAAAPDLRSEWTEAEPMQEALLTHTAETLPEAKRESELLFEPELAAGEVIFSPVVWGLTEEAGAAADGAPETPDIWPGAELDETAAVSQAAAGISRVMRQSADVTETAVPRLADSRAVFKEDAPVDIDELAKQVAERLRERLEIMLQSRPFV